VASHPSSFPKLENGTGLQSPLIHLNGEDKGQSLRVLHSAQLLAQVKSGHYTSLVPQTFLLEHF